MTVKSHKLPGHETTVLRPFQRAGAVIFCRDVIAALWSNMVHWRQPRARTGTNVP